MSDYKNRDDVITEIKRFKGYLDDDMITRLTIAIDKISSADVVKARHGHWLLDSSGAEFCSECGEYPFDDGEYHISGWSSKYCPNCGAKMDEEEQEHES